MPERNASYYGPLKSLAVQRDTDCREAYGRILGFAAPLPDEAVLHHVAHRGGCPSRDSEDNVITLTWEDHRDRAHGPEELRYRKLFSEYLRCEEVEAWRKEHAAEIAAFEQKKEDSRIRAVRKHCAVKSVQRIR